MPLKSLFPSVKADDDELVDPQEELRNKCRETPHCQHLAEKLQECNDRVNSRSKTSETCVEELIDFMHAIDHCVTKDLFKRLKTPKTVPPPRPKRRSQPMTFAKSSSNADCDIIKPSLGSTPKVTWKLFTQSMRLVKQHPNRISRDKLKDGQHPFAILPSKKTDPRCSLIKRKLKPIKLKTNIDFGQYFLDEIDEESCKERESCKTNAKRTPKTGSPPHDKKRASEKSNDDASKFKFERGLLCSPHLVPPQK